MPDPRHTIAIFFLLMAAVAYVIALPLAILL